jgi:hypothetical protein
MAQTLAIPGRWSVDLALAMPDRASDDVAGLRRLPDEWQVVDEVVLADTTIDHVVVGPNGVFTVSVDRDPTPAFIADDGLYRSGSRVTEAVESALSAGQRLRADLGDGVFAYPLLVSSVAGDRAHLDRLGIVAGDRIAEAIWSHPGRPMIRSARLETLRSIRRRAR